MDQAERDRRLLALVDSLQTKTYRKRMGRPMKPNPVILGIESLGNPKARPIVPSNKPEVVQALEDWLDKP